VINSRRLKWPKHEAHMTDIREAYRFWSVNLKVRGTMEDLGVDGEMTIKEILTEENV
jgi:hypothetical protein